MDQQLLEKSPVHSEQLNKNVVYCNDKYSLYSTDTEERIISMDRGLGRCTEMLKSLMGVNKDEMQTTSDDKGKVGLRVKPSLTSKKGRVLSNRLLRHGFKEEKGNTDRRKGRGDAPQTKPLEQEKEHHTVRPAACSTPNKSKPNARHTRARTEPRDGHLVGKRASSTPPRRMLQQSWSTEDIQQHSAPHKGNIRAHRRLKTVPSKSLAPGDTECGNAIPAESSSDQKGSVPTSTTHPPVPPPPPPLFHPYYLPYNLPYFPPYSYPCYPSVVPTGWPRGPMEAGKFISPETHQVETADFPPTFHHPSHFNTLNFPGDQCGNYYRSSPRVPDQLDQVHESRELHDPAPAAQQSNQPDDIDFKETEPAYHHHQVFDVDSDGMGVLLHRFLTSCEESIEKIKTECAHENPHLGSKLEDLQRSLKHNKQHLCQRLDEDQKIKKVSEPSVVDLLSCIQELEKERAGLMKSLKESCTAYTEVRRDLDNLEKQMKEQDTELGEKREKVSTLQSELNRVSSGLSQTVADLRMTKETLVSTKSEANSSNQELVTKNAALQKRIHSLFEEMTKTKKNSQRLVEELSMAKCAQETSKNDEEMMKVTVLEKNAQLLHAEDRLLGLRQCLAHFLSEFTKFDPLGQSETTAEFYPLYCVSEIAVEKLKLLADEGDIDRFLASYTDKNSSFDAMGDNQGSSISSVSSTITEGEYNPPKLPRHFDVITPLCSNSNSSDSYTYPQKSVTNSPNHIYKEGGSPSETHSNTYSQPQSEAFNKHRHYPGTHQLKSTLSHSSIDVKSTVTTASEIDFRNDLASLDANIARLQTQFRVALQPSK